MSEAISSRPQVNGILETCAWRIDTEAGNGQIRETRCDEELQLRMICSPSLCPR